MRRFLQTLDEGDDRGSPLGAPMLWPDGRHIAANGLGRIFLWDIESGECVRVLPSKSIYRDGDPVFQLTCDAELGRVLDGHGLRNFAVCDARDWRCLQTFVHHSEEVQAARFVTEDRIVSVSGDSTACLWDAWSGACLRSLDTAPLYGLAAHPKDARLAICGGSGYVAVLDGPSLAVQTSFRVPMVKAQHAALDEVRKRQVGIVWNRPSEVLRALAWHPDGEQLICGGWDFVPKLINAKSGKRVRAWHGHAHWIAALAVDVASRRLITASSDGTVRVWALDKEDCLAVFDVGHANIGGLLVHDGNIYLTRQFELLVIPLPPN